MYMQIKAGNNAVTWLMAAGVLLCLLQVWLPGMYLTCDGPCHVYNARILHDMWTSEGKDFFGRFYEIAYTTAPNSLTSFLLAGLLYVANGVVAEKIYISLYILVYIGGFTALLRRLGGSGFWLLSVFLFPFTYAFAKGFYNYSFAIGLWCWMVWAWLHYLHHMKPRYAVAFFVLSGLAFFTHLLPFAFGVATCGLLLLSHVLPIRDPERRRGLEELLRKGLTFILLIAPYLLLMLLFTNNEGGLQLQLRAYPYRLIELVEFKYLINLTDGEKPWALVAGLVLTGFFAATAFRAMRPLRLHRYDGILAAMVFVAFVYVFFPEQFMGRMLIISIRAQLFIYILIVCFVAYRLPAGKWKDWGGLALFGCFMLLSINRIHTRSLVAEAMSDYLSVAPYVQPGSVVLPLDLSPTGTTPDGREISPRNSLFHHASHYLAADKQLIMLDNYEANMGYFPVRWQPDVNPYNIMSRNAGIEGLPPYAQIGTWEQRTGRLVRYVLLWGHAGKYTTHADFARLMQEVAAGYNLRYQSPTGRAVLYERKGE
jgi:hypothetical protein